MEHSLTRVMYGVMVLRYGKCIHLVNYLMERWPEHRYVVSISS